MDLRYLPWRVYSGSDIVGMTTYPDCAVWMARVVPQAGIQRGNLVVLNPDERDILGDTRAATETILMRWLRGDDGLYHVISNGERHE